MLIEKNIAPKPGDVVTVKIMTGDELVGRLGVGDATCIVLEKPVVLQVHPTKQGLQMAFAPLLFAMDEEQTRIRIDNSKVVIGPMRARAEVAQQFIQATTSIAVPTSSLIRP